MLFSSFTSYYPYSITKKYKEKFSNDENLHSDTPISILVISLMIDLIIGIYAAYLSYNCSWDGKESEFTKVIFSIFAFLMGLLYLIYYFLVNYLGRRCI